MTLLAIEGFEQFDPDGYLASPVEAYAKIYERSISSIGSGRSTRVTGRLGGSALRILKTSVVYGHPLSGATNEIITGFAFKYTAASVEQPILVLRNGSASIGLLALGFNKTTGALAVYKDVSSLGSLTTIATGASGRLQASTWYYIEARLRVHAGGVEADIRVNSVPYISTTSSAAASSSFDHVRVGSFDPNFDASGNQILDFDDWYVLNTAGSANNTFLGDCTVEQITLGSVAAGNAFVGTGAGSVVEAVSEATIDFDTSYASSATDEDALLLAPAAQDESYVRRIHGLDTTMVLRKSTSDAVTAQIVAKIDGVEGLGTTTSITGSVDYGYTVYHALRHLVEVSPSTGARLDIQALAAGSYGVRIKSLAGSAELRVTKAHLAVLQASTRVGARPTISTTIIGNPA